MNIDGTEQQSRHQRCVGSEVHHGLSFTPCVGFDNYSLAQLMAPTARCIQTVIAINATSTLWLGSTTDALTTKNVFRPRRLTR
jgi:hypothetical protein